MPIQLDFRSATGKVDGLSEKGVSRRPYKGKEVSPETSLRSRSLFKGTGGYTLSLYFSVGGRTDNGKKDKYCDR